MTERQLIAASKAGDHQAFLQLLGRYDRQIMSVVYRFTGNLYDREDLYQEVFLHAFGSLRSYKGRSAFATWLYRVALNRCIHYMKKKPAVDPLEDEAVDGEDMERRARLKAVHRAASRLRGPQRICFHLHYVEGWASREIAETLGCGEGTVKSHLHRARTKIKGEKEVLFWQTSPS